MIEIKSNLDYSDLYEHELRENQISKYLFTSDEHGYLKQWCIKKQKLMKDFGKKSG